ncbi:MAG: YceI family protein [Planctomycetaceae bacterium]|nr:YceI family protein [Planctomycetaceae bacterium]
MKRYLMCFATLAFAAGCASEEPVADPAVETEHGGVDEAAYSENAAAGEHDEHGDHEHVMFALSGDNTEVLFTGVKDSGDSHSGGFKTLTGEMEICEDKVIGLMVTIETDSLWSDADRLTGHLKNEDFFSVNEFPEMKFESSSITGDGEVTVTGMLTMHGETAEISFPATISVEDDSVKMTSEFQVDRTKFGMDYVGKADDPIKPEVDIKVTVGG